MMAAKELKALVDIGTSLGYTGEDLKQWLNDERMRIDREKEKRQEEEEKRQEEEKKRQEEEKKRAFELEKLKIEAEAERAKIEAEREKESERMKFEAEAERAKIEAEKEKESERMKLEAEAERAKIEAEKEKESERMKLEAEKESESRRQEFELRKLEMEHDLRMREVQVNVEQNGSGEGGVPRSNRGHSVAMKALKLPLFNDEKDDLDAYLVRFEIRPEFWSTQLARLLQGRSLDVYQRLPAEEVDNYESLKNQLLKRFRLTEGVYRKKFKMSKLEVGETPEQFVERPKQTMTSMKPMDTQVIVTNFQRDQMATRNNPHRTLSITETHSHLPLRTPEHDTVTIVG